MLVRGSSALAVLSTLGVIGLVGRFALQSHAFVTRARAADVPTAPMRLARETRSSPAFASSAPTSQGASAAPVARPAPPIEPILPPGTSTLADSMTATRVDSEVTVSFDTRLGRTRMPDKFERIVRETLPAVYGHAADSALARLPGGALARQGDLITELPTRGLRIPAAPGLSIVLYPITRPGVDGPLVTAYRVTVVRG